MSRASIPLVSGLVLALGCGGGRDDDDGPAPFVAVEGFPESQALYSVWSFAPDDVWVAADGGRMLHYDGAAWSVSELGPGGFVLDLWGFAPNDLWGAGGTSLSHWDGSTWTVTDLSAVGAGISSVSSLWGSSATDLWVGGDQSTAARFDGTNWVRYLAAGPDNEALWGSGPSDVYTGSVFGVAHWDGSAWTDLEDFYHGASAIFGFGPDDVWVADGDCLSHFDGATWEPTELDGLGGISAMWGPASDDIWGVGDFGSVWRYDGSEWDEVQRQRLGSPFLQQFLDVHGSGSGDVWIVGVKNGDDGITPQLYRRG